MSSKNVTLNVHVDTSVTHSSVGVFDRCSSVATVNCHDKEMEFGQYSGASALSGLINSSI